MTAPRPGTAPPWVPLAALAAPALIYLAVLAANAVNVPRGDDSFSILPFLCDWKENPSAWTRLGLVFSQYFSHRIVLTKCVALALWGLTGRHDPIALQALGWIGWIALAALLVAATPAARRDLRLAWPLGPLLMNPQGFSNMTSGMQAVQNIGVVLAAAATMTAAARAGRKALAASLLLATVATAASVNGILVFPCAAVGLWRRGRPRAAAAHLLAGAAAGAAYFHAYAWARGPLSLGRLVANALVMAGGFADLARAPLVGVAAAGLVVIALSAACLLRRATWSQAPAPACFLLFLLASVAMAAAGRLQVDPAYMTQDRYRLYGLLALACVFLIEAGRRDWRGPALAAAVATSLAFCALSYASRLPDLLTEAARCRAEAVNRQLGGALPVSSTASWEVSKRCIERAESAGIYHFPRLLDAGQEQGLRGLRPPPPSGAFRFEAAPNGGLNGYVLSPAEGAEPPAKLDLAVLFLDNRLVVLPRLSFRARLWDVLLRGRFLGRGLRYLLPESIYRPGRHELLGVALSAGRATVAWSGRADCPAYGPLPP